MLIIGCGSQTAANTELAPDIISQTKCQPVKVALGILKKNNFFAITETEGITALSPIFNNVPANSNRSELDFSYRLEPVDKGWSKDTEIHYTNNTKDGRTLFEGLEIEISPQCFEKPLDLMKMMIYQLGAPHHQTEWDETFGARAEWIFPSEDPDIENTITVESGKNYQIVKIERRPAPTEPF